jgi:hypothetical protein
MIRLISDEDLRGPPQFVVHERHPAIAGGFVSRPQSQQPWRDLGRQATPYCLAAGPAQQIV